MSDHQALREAVCEGNRRIGSDSLALLTWGNVSAVDRRAGVMAIKPSGIDYAALRPDEIVVIGLTDGKPVAGTLRPSSDTPTHLHLYRAFPTIGAVVHTHSRAATVFAQALQPIPCLGTTHADYFHGPVPVTRFLVDLEIERGYEHHTGTVIQDCFERHGLDPVTMPAVLVGGHAPFVWGPTVERALENAVVLEAVAEMARQTLTLNPDASPLPERIAKKHFERKNGPSAYYGQGGK